MQRTSKAMKKATVVLLSLIPVQAEVYQKPLTVFHPLWKTNYHTQKSPVQNQLIWSARVAVDLENKNEL